jgi:hypothetical protein
MIKNYIKIKGKKQIKKHKIANMKMIYKNNKICIKIKLKVMK